MKESEPVNVDSPPFSAAKVLVLDTFVTMQTVFSTLFRHYGNTNLSYVTDVNAACIGVQIVHYDIIVTTEPPHVVHKLLDFIRSVEATKDIYVLVISANDIYKNSMIKDPQDRRTEYLLGKEITPDDLKDKIKQIAENWDKEPTLNNRPN